MYTFGLSIYYLMVVALKWNDHKIKRVEEWFHPIIITISTTFAVSGIPLTLYNNANLWCWISSVPRTCKNGLSPNGSGPCERGLYAWIFRWAYFYGPLWACIVGVTICMGTVAYFAIKDEKQTRMFRTHHALSPTDRDNLRILTSDVVWQAFLYLPAFYITRTFPTVARVHEMLGKPIPYFCIFLQAAIGPTHGFWNALIYFRPRYLRYRRKQIKRMRSGPTTPGSMHQHVRKITWRIHGLSSASREEAAQQQQQQQQQPLTEYREGLQNTGGDETSVDEGSFSDTDSMVEYSVDFRQQSLRHLYDSVESFNSSQQASQSQRNNSNNNVNTSSQDNIIEEGEHFPEKMSREPSFGERHVTFAAETKDNTTDVAHLEESHGTLHGLNDQDDEDSRSGGVQDNDQQWNRVVDRYWMRDQTAAAAEAEMGEATGDSD